MNNFTFTRNALVSCLLQGSMPDTYYDEIERKLTVPFPEDNPHGRQLSISFLFHLFTALTSSHKEDPKLMKTLATITSKVVSNLIRFVGNVPQNPTSALAQQHLSHETVDRMYSDFATKMHDRLNAMEVIFLIARNFQFTETEVRDIAKLVLDLATEVERNGTAPNFVDSGISGRSHGKSAEACRWCTLQVASLTFCATLNVSNPLRERQTGGLQQPLPCSSGSLASNTLLENASLLDFLVTWLTTLHGTENNPQQYANIQQHRLPPALVQVGSICTLAVGCALVAAGQRDRGLDIAFEACQTAAINSESARITTEVAPSESSKFPEFGDAFRYLGSIIPSPLTTSGSGGNSSLLSLTLIPREAYAQVVLRILRNLCSPSLLPLLKHLADIDVNSYKASHAYYQHVSHQQTQQSQQPGSHALSYQPVHSHKAPGYVEPTFFICDLLTAAAEIFDMLEPGAPILDDPDYQRGVALLRQSQSDLENQLMTDDYGRISSPAECFLHFLLHNVPRHLRSVLDCHRQHGGRYDAYALKGLAALCRVLCRVGRTRTGILRLDELETQVECPEVQGALLLQQVRECLGLGFQSQHQQFQERAPTGVYAPLGKHVPTTVYTDKQAVAFVCEVLQLVSTVELTLTTPDVGNDVLGADPCSPNRRSLITHQPILSREFHCDVLFSFLQAQYLSYLVAGEIFAAIASKVNTAAAAAHVRNRLQHSSNGQDTHLSRPTNATERPSNLTRVEPNFVARIRSMVQQEIRQGSCALTIGVLKLTLAVLQFQSHVDQADALNSWQPIEYIRLAADDVLCGMSRRQFPDPSVKHIVTSLASAVLARALSPECWDGGASDVPFSVAVAPQAAPSDIIGEAIVIIREAANDAVGPLMDASRTNHSSLYAHFSDHTSAVHSISSNPLRDGNQMFFPPLRVVCLRTVLGLVIAALSSSAPGADGFTTRGRTADDPEFLAALLRLAAIDDAATVTLALRLVAQLKSPTASAAAKLLMSSPDYGMRIASTISRYACGAAAEAANVVAVPYALHCLNVTQEALLEAASPAPPGDVLRDACIDLALVNSGYAAPSLTTFLCGYCDEDHLIGNFTPGFGHFFGLGSNHQRSAGEALLSSHGLLHACLRGLNDPQFMTRRPAVASKYAQLVFLLLSNPTTSTPGLLATLRARNGLGFIDALYLLGATTLSSQEVSIQGTPGNEDNIYNAANQNSQSSPKDAAAIIFACSFALRTLALQLHIGAVSPGSAKTATPDVVDQELSSLRGGLLRQWDLGSVPSDLAVKHLPQALAPCCATSPPTLLRMLDSNGTRKGDLLFTAEQRRIATGGRPPTVLLQWLLTVLESAPTLPPTPPAVISLSSCGSGLSAAAGSGGLFITGNVGQKHSLQLGIAEETPLVPLYDVGKIYARLRRMEEDALANLPENDLNAYSSESPRPPQSQAKGRNAAQWQQLLGPVLAANECFRAYVQIRTFVAAWTRFVEVLCASYHTSWDSPSLLQCARVLLYIIDSLRTTAKFNNIVAQAVTDDLLRAVGAVFSVLRRKEIPSYKNSVFGNDSFDATPRGLVVSAATPQHQSTLLQFVDPSRSVIARTQQHCQKFGISPEELTSLLALLPRIILSHPASGIETVRHHLYHGILALLNTATKLSIAVDDSVFLPLFQPLCLNLVQDAANGAPATRILALTCLSILMERPVLCDSLVHSERILQSSTALIDQLSTNNLCSSAELHMLVSGVASAVDASVCQILATVFESNSDSLREQPSHLLSRDGTAATGAIVDSYFTLLKLLIEEHPLPLLHSDCIGSISRMKCWRAVSSVFQSEHLFDIFPPQDCSTGGAAFGLSSFQNAAQHDIALRFATGALETLGTLTAKIGHHHDEAPNILAQFVRNHKTALLTLCRGEVALRAVRWAEALVAPTYSRIPSQIAAAVIVGARASQATSAALQFLFWISTIPSLAPHIPELTSSLSSEGDEGGAALCKVSRALGECAAKACIGFLATNFTNAGSMPTHPQAHVNFGTMSLATATCFANASRSALGILLNCVAPAPVAATSARQQQEVTAASVKKILSVEPLVRLLQSLGQASCSPTATKIIQDDAKAPMTHFLQTLRDSTERCALLLQLAARNDMLALSYREAVHEIVKKLMPNQKSTQSELNGSARKEADFSLFSAREGQPNPGSSTNVSVLGMLLGGLHQLTGPSQTISRS